MNLIITLNQSTLTFCVHHSASVTSRITGAAGKISFAKLNVNLNSITSTPSRAKPTGFSELKKPRRHAFNFFETVTSLFQIKNYSFANFNIKISLIMTKITIVYYKKKFKPDLNITLK